MSRLLLVAFDVSGLTDEQADMLAMEATVQGEASEYHDDVPVLGTRLLTADDRHGTPYADGELGPLYVTVLWR